MITQTGTESELIYRQQAIDAFNTNFNELVVGGEENAKTVENYLNRVLETIKSLPPAQPEIVRCKDCKHFLSPHGCGHDDGMITADENGFCSYAEERRTDETD